MQKTVRQQYQFWVTRNATGRLLLVMDATGGGLPCLRRGGLSFELKRAVTVQQAKWLAEVLNERVSGVAYTT